MLKHLTFEERNYLSKSLQESLRGIGDTREYINGIMDETTEIRRWLRDDVAGGMILIGEKHMDADGMKELKELIKKLLCN
ncbi:MAG: hypothetical protein JSW06_09385 [Thermoplasmatales archaeon]|nr:MAG: hypothetical protein JSW06_09385 [Thermoplasmatales archaeon]